ncbi:conserved hypothetical protein [Paecilomyces variotii No. 5]|uniref:Regulator of volume decrease after cellular swelling-domain-containing protein n=1 Tax=Byssochlamys spectabilis (strain No. 5 / NBRC 109023) TaxID=1356009 RepID=V5FKT7_BYSSN|nr:conserved hypothetical protein [Paecilomyces variotii No. 5]
MEVLRSPPSTSSFVPLAEHQARTPASFYSGPPVLHYVSERCKVVVLERDLLAAPAINAMRREGSSNTANGNENGVNGSSQAANGEEEEGKEVVLDDIDVWVTSECVKSFSVPRTIRNGKAEKDPKFLLYSSSTKSGVAIPYPSISLHAIQRLSLPSAPSSDQVQGLYMQIAHPSSAPTEDDEEEESISLTVVPPPASETAVTTSAEAATTTAAERAVEDITEKPETPTQLLFAAVSACSNLHPDPATAGEDEDDEGGVLQGSSLYEAGLIAPGSGDGGLPPPAAGSSGWITEENMHEYFDEEGNWIGGGEEPNLSLGPGAGTVRTREEEDAAADGSEETGDGDETKWRRTD